MKYCPRCAQELISRPEGGRDRLACPGPECKFVHFGDFSIGVGAVVICDGKVLLIRRGHEPGRGWWQLPGGYAEHDEPLVESIEREVLEEAGVKAKVGEVLGFRHSVGGQSSIGGASTNIYVAFRLDPEDSALEPSCDGDEITGAQYWPIEEALGNERVQNLTKWAIGWALSGARGLAPAERPLDPSRPPWKLFHVPALPEKATKRARLVELLKERSLQRGDFMLRSGRRSTYFLDGKGTTLSAEGAVLVGELLFDRVKELGVNAIGGLTLGADPIATAVSAESWRQGRPIDAFIVRKETKDHGMGELIAGPLRRGSRVAIVEDTVTTGSAIQAAIDAVRAADCEVARVLAIVDREAGAREHFARQGIEMEALFTIRDLGINPEREP